MYGRRRTQTQETDMARKLANTKKTSAHCGGTPSPRTFEGWRISGEGPPYMKLGRNVLYDLDVVDAWLDARRRTSTSDPGPDPQRQSAYKTQ